MLTKDFLEFLEYQLTKAFDRSQHIELKGFWCDGILPAIESENSLLEKKEISLTAFLGKDGQGKYDLTLRFGVKSLHNYTNGLDLTECVPDPEIQGLV